MVSLGESGSRQGGYFQFNNDASVNSLSNEDIYGQILGPDDEPKFRRIKSTVVIFIQIFLVVAMVVVAWLLPHYCLNYACAVPTESMLIYSHTGLWFLLLLLNRILWRLHSISRRNGYLDFYRKTRNIRRVPLMVYSAGSALLGTLLVILNDYCTKLSEIPHCSNGFPLGRLQYLKILFSLEGLLTLPPLLMYTVWTIKFNRRKALPDGHQDDMIQAFLNGPARDHNSDIGFKDDRYLDEVLEKQADLIRYLQLHNAQLGMKIMTLKAQLRDNQSTTT